MKRLYAALVAGALFFSACSGSEKPAEKDDSQTVSTTIPQILLEGAPLADHSIPDYMASEDTFSFANFGGGEAPAVLTLNMTSRQYRDSQV